MLPLRGWVEVVSVVDGVADSGWQPCKGGQGVPRGPRGGQSQAAGVGAGDGARRAYAEEVLG